jgi:hypothetical protein
MSVRNAVLGSLLMSLGSCGGAVETSSESFEVVESRSFDVMVYASQSPNPPGAHYYVGTAFRVDEPPCRGERSGECTLWTCQRGSHGPPESVPHAGALTVAGAALPISLMPDIHGFYENVNEYSSKPSPLWKGGETLQLFAKGGAIPAFELHLQAPKPIVMTEPVQTHNAVVVNGDKALTVRWIGGGDVTHVNVSPNSYDSAVGYLSILCMFPSSAQMGVVPPTMLSRVAGGEASVSLSAVSEATATAGGYDIAFIAVEYGQQTVSLRVD